MLKNNDSVSTRSSLWHFEIAHPIWFALIFLGMSYVSLLAYMPEVIPFDQLGFIGAIGQKLYLEYQIGTILLFWFAWSCHFFEALYVVKVANECGLSTTCLTLWFLQTICLGYASTHLIRKYRKKEQIKLKSQ